MKKFLIKAAVATAVAMAFSGSVLAQAVLTNGSITVGVDAAGNINTGGANGVTPGLSYLSNEYVNWDDQSSWYWLTSSSPASSALAQYGSNPLGATTTAVGASAATTFSVGSLAVSILHNLTLPNQYSNSVTITNTSGSAITGVQWSVGFDPDQGRFGASGGTNTTTNIINGTGNAASVYASAGGLTPIILANTTSAGAFAVAAYINSGDCCTAVSAATAIAAAQSSGYMTIGDDSISLGYDIGTIAANQSVTIGYSYTFANPVPEPETYAMLLAGLGLMGFVARRRKQKLAVA